MHLAFTPQEEAFRQQVSAFLKAELPSGYVGPEEGDEFRRDESWEFVKAFAKKLAHQGWLTIAWPKEYGGQARPVMEQLVYMEEMAYHMVPTAALDMGVGGIGWVGPTLMVYGSEEQKKEHLAPLGSGERFWCTGYSEPESGSDLASLQTRAVSQGDEYLVNGQKIWTSGAHRADWCWLAVRTNPEAPKHKGISLLLLDMKAPGITIRPIYNLAEGHEFNQVFFQDVRVPKRNLVGEENQGWYYIAVALDFERSHIRDAANQKRKLDELIAYLKRGSNSFHGEEQKRVLRHRLAESAIQLEVSRWMAYRVAWMQGQGLVPNREASICKIFATETRQKLAGSAMETLGLFGQFPAGSKWSKLKGMFQRDYMLSLSGTIAGGTSEIQRSIIARRGLDLPKG